MPRTTINENPLIEYSKRNAHVKFYHSDFDKFTDTIKKLNTIALDLAIEHNYTESRKYFLKALEISPNDVVLLNNIGTLEKNDDQFIEAIKYYKESFRKSDSLYYVAALNLAQTYSIIGTNREAERTFDKVIKMTNIDFFNGITYYYLADHFLKYGNIDKGKNALSKARSFLEKYEGFNRELNELSEKLDNYNN